MKKILITGGAGFIGSHLVDSLLAEEHARVVVVDNFNDFYSPAVKYNNIERHVADPRFTLVKADICDHERIEATFKTHKPDCVVHLAARAGVRPSLEQPELYVETNIGGTLKMLEAARRHNVGQFVFASSSSVYGINNKVPFREDDFITRPVSPYAATKAAGEMLCHTYSHLYGLRCVCLRFFTVYGARQRPDLAIHKFAKIILDKAPLPVFGDGTTRRDYTYIDDIIEGVRAALEYRETPFEIINLGESQAVELARLIEILEAGLGIKSIIKRLPEQPGDVPQTFADIEKARRLLGYNPQTAIEDGIGRFLEWFMAHKPSNLTDFENFKQLRQMSVC